MSNMQCAINSEMHTFRILASNQKASQRHAANIIDYSPFNVLKAIMYIIVNGILHSIKVNLAGI